MVLLIKFMCYFVCVVFYGSLLWVFDELNVVVLVVVVVIDQIEVEFQFKLVIWYCFCGIIVMVSGWNMVQKFVCFLEDYEVVMVEGQDLKQVFKGDVCIGYYVLVVLVFLFGFLVLLGGLEYQVIFYLEECDNYCV